MSLGKENASVEEVEYGWGGDSWVMRLPSKAAVERLRRVLYDVKCYLLSRNFQVVGVGVLVSGCAFFSVWISKESCLL